MCFSLYLAIGHAGGGQGGSPKELVHNVLMPFFTLESSKPEVDEISVFDTVIT